MEKREALNRIFKCVLSISTVIMFWKGLMVLTNCTRPIMVMASGAMEPAFHVRGDLLLSTNYHAEPIRVGDVVVFRVQNFDIPTVHRVIRVHEKDDGYVKLLTKGDFNAVDDRGLYPSGQLWLEKKDIVGKVKGYFPYVGIFIILMHDYPGLKFLVPSMIGLFDLIQRMLGKRGGYSERKQRFLNIWICFTITCLLVSDAYG